MNTIDDVIETLSHRIISLHAKADDIRREASELSALQQRLIEFTKLGTGFEEAVLALLQRGPESGRAGAVLDALTFSDESVKAELEGESDFISHEELLGRLSD
jgi:hypothetical protein